MTTTSAANSVHLRVAVVVTCLYALLAAYYSFSAGRSAVIFTLCLAPYLISAWALVFTAPTHARASFAVAATGLLAAVGTVITSSADPKAGQLWWLLLLCLPLSALGSGMAANYLTPRLSLKPDLLVSLLAALAVGISPFAALAFLR